MRIRLLCLLPAALGALAVHALVGPTAAPRAEGEASSPLDYRFYKARISPALMELCGECHADPRKRSKMGRFFLRPAPGRRLRERYHERNFEAVGALVEPRNPAASLLLLKALGAQRGGVTHEGGGVLDDNTPEYGALIDWINGTRLPPDVFTPPESPAGQPDFLFFYKRIEPVLLHECAECHAGRGKGNMRVVTHERGEPFPIEDHYRNYQMALKLVTAGRPDRSRFLTKPLAEDAGGIKHRGGDRFAKDGENHQNWVLFINGERGPPLPAEGDEAVVDLTAEGLVVQAEDFDLGPGLGEQERKGADDFYVVVPDAQGGRASLQLLVRDPGAYVLEFRLVPGAVPLRWAFDEGEGRELVAQPGTVPDEHGFVRVGPENLLDGSAPLQDARGGLALRAGVLQMDGRRAEAAWLSPSDVRHTGAAARVLLAHDEEGGGDALLHFDALDTANAKFVGLTDGGRRFVIGLVESGTPRALRSAKAPEPEPQDLGRPREMKVEYFGGVAVGSLDGKPLVFANLSENLGRGRFGLMTHGLVGVHSVAALEEYEVYAVRFGRGSIVDLPPGPVRLWVEWPAGAGALDALHLRPSQD